jgi:hypothetical protein
MGRPVVPFVLSVFLLVASVAGIATATAESEYADPETDVLGWEGGYWADEPIDIDQSDGLSAAELRRVKYRTMARVEQLRGLEFTSDVDIEFRTPAAMKRSVTANVSQVRGSDHLWEALFVFDADTDSRAVIQETIGSSVAGMATEEGIDHVVLVAETPDSPQLSTRVLAHELVHVLQHQHFDLWSDRYQRSTLDGEFAKDGLVEGEAAYLDGEFAARCAGGEWQCLPDPDQQTGTSGTTQHTIRLLLGIPYADGEVYVEHLVDTGGWDAVNDAHRTVPQSAEAFLHPGSTDDRPAIQFADAARSGWVRASERPDVAGEIGIFAMFYQQSLRHDLDLVDRSAVYTNDPADPLNVTAPPSAGWGNDALVAYEKGRHRGYVWKTAWDSERDADQFRAAYETVLRANGANRTGDGRWVIANGSFAGVYAVDHSDAWVTIVHGPTAAAVDVIRPDTIEAGASSTGGQPATTRGPLDEAAGPTAVAGRGVLGPIGVVALAVLVAVGYRIRR